MSDALRDLYVTLEDLIRSEFKNSDDIKVALKAVNDAIRDFDSAVDVTKEEALEVEEARRISRTKMRGNPLLENLEDKYKDLVADLALKYDKEPPTDVEFKERVYRRIVDLDDDVVLNLAFGRSTIERIGRSVSKENCYEEGLKALRVDSFLPKNIESTYGSAIENVYKHKSLFLAFLVDYFRN